MRNGTLKPFMELLNYIRPFRKDYIPAIIYSCLNKVCDILPEIILGVAINSVVKKENSWLAGLGFDDIKVQFLLLGLVTLCTYGLESLFEYLFSIKWWRLGQKVQHSLRMDTFSHVQQTTMIAFSKEKTGNLISAMNDDTNQICHFFEEVADKIIEIIASTALISCVFFYISKQIAFFVMIPIPIIAYLVLYFQKKLTPLHLSIREKAGALASRLTNGLLGFITIKSLVAEHIEKKKLNDYSLIYKEANFKAIKLGALVVPIIRFAILFGFMITLIYGGLLTINDKLDVGAYSTLIFLTQRLLWPFADLGEVIIAFQKAMSSTQRLLNLLKLELEFYPNENIVLGGNVNFCSVSFKYEKRNLDIDNMSFSIEPKQTVAFVGATGAGKSTLIKLLMGFYTPLSGEIFFDNKEIRTLSLAALRKQIGLVSQDIFLFEGTIAENISYAYSNINKNDIIDAAKIAEAHDFIISLPEGYDTWIGERGEHLSAGQKQRIAIARAIVHKPSILILDEATSALDNETEAKIKKSIQSLKKSCTIIIIAHRLSTIKSADLIFVLDHGKIVESGTHDQLLGKNKFYARLCNILNYSSS